MRKNFEEIFSTIEIDTVTGRYFTTIPEEIMPYITDIVGEGQAAQQHPVLGWIGSLSTLDGSKGYWFKVTEPIQFQFINSDPLQVSPPVIKIDLAK